MKTLELRFLFNRTILQCWKTWKLYSVQNIIINSFNKLNANPTLLSKKRSVYQRHKFPHSAQIRWEKLAWSILKILVKSLCHNQKLLNRWTNLCYDIRYIVKANKSTSCSQIVRNTITIQFKSTYLWTS